MASARLLAALRLELKKLQEEAADLKSQLSQQRIAAGKCAVLFYNVFEGRPLEKLGRFLEKSDYDIVGLAECNGWNTKLAECCVQWGYKYCELLVAPTKFHIAVVSKIPFEVIHNEQDKNNVQDEDHLTDKRLPAKLRKSLGTRVFWHGLLHIVIR